ncbi:unnamed protein product [Eruca vesicaria subsp. sativa]|uniref:PSI-K n=1 Tax=Eruca vesicaria subsp. sativa TaxID=29727 RepID=A0ABC8JRW7_ERUVS|nr:unnamed protein product [Eruca vesicaria subsp. sativa]
MASTVMTTLPQFNGLRASKISAAPVKGLIMVTSTTLMLFAERFGLAPSANRKATAGLKLEARDSGLQTGDPAGFTLADTLACGTVGHIIGVGVVLGLKNIGAI